MKNRKIISTTAEISMLLVLLLIAFPVTSKPLNAAPQMQWVDDKIGLNGSYIDTLTVRFIPSLDSLLLALKVGEVDVITPMLNYQMAMALNGTENIGVSVASVPENGIVCINLGNGPDSTTVPGTYYALSNLKFRQALNYAIGDKQWMKEIYGTFNDLDNGWIGKMYGDWYDPGVVVPQDFDKARELLDEAGFKVGPDGWRRTPDDQEIHIIVQYNAAIPEESLVWQRVTLWWREELQINADMRGLPFATLCTNGFALRKYDIMGLSGRWNTPSPEYPLTVWLLSTAGANIQGYSNERFDELAHIAEFSPDPAEAKKAVHEMNRIITEDLPGWTFGYLKAANAYRTDEFSHWVNQPGKGIWYSHWNALNVRLKNGLMGGNLVIGCDKEETLINPQHSACADVCRFYSKLVYSSLIQQDSPWEMLNEDLTPDLAESWKIEDATVAGEDGQVITFNLRQDVYWHDGVKFTSEDIAWNIKMYGGPCFPGMGDLNRNCKYIDHVETPDDYTVKVYVTEKSSWWPLWLGVHYVLPKHIYKDLGEELCTFTGLDPAPVGTGPFKFVSYTAGVSMVFEKNPDYYRPAKAAPIDVTEPTPEPTIDTRMIVISAVAIVVVLGVIALALKRKKKKGTR